MAERREIGVAGARGLSGPVGLGDGGAGRCRLPLFDGAQGEAFEVAVRVPLAAGAHHGGKGAVFVALEYDAHAHPHGLAFDDLALFPLILVGEGAAGEVVVAVIGADAVVAVGHRAVARTIWLGGSGRCRAA